MKTNTIFMLMLLVGCTIESGDVTASYEFNKCIDTRDGEEFTLVGNTARNARVGIGAPSCVDIDDTTGRTRTLCSYHTAWIKCEVE